MSSISQNNSNEVALLDCVQKFFIKHHVGRLLKQCNGTKEKGVSAVSLLKYKMGNIFTGRSMYMQQKTGSFKEAFSKNTFYRFLNSTKTNWLRFTSLLAADIVKNDLKHLTDDSRKNVFIIDDSLFHRTSCKKTELGSKVFDHTGMNYKKGFRMLTVSWSDGNTLIPVNSCLLASSKESNIIGPVKAFDKRTLAGKRRKLAQTKAPEAMLTLLDTAVSAGLSAEYVLFDSWFSNPAQITALKSRGMDVIAMIKKSSRIKYTYGEDQLNIKEIYSRNKKRRGRSRYLLSVDVMVGKENPIPAKIVCVRNKANRKDWLAFICTDTSLSEEEIIRIYGKRWKIEVFFKTCKINFYATFPESTSSSNVASIFIERDGKVTVGFGFINHSRELPQQYDGYNILEIDDDTHLFGRYFNNRDNSNIGHKGGNIGTFKLSKIN